ncbi:hypothetical protein OJAV_G00217930 [Oryzias javanicus]|uniref:Uncharacterized protein n=1 Tax=Oryzias javanicus TaxID=123683 RepID=A0A437C4F8_ORYJA|nr:hypothetical protein OJAV_G00217930 [Oryzias javanicus]
MRRGAGSILTSMARPDWKPAGRRKVGLVCVLCGGAPAPTPPPPSERQRDGSLCGPRSQEDLHQPGDGLLSVSARRAGGRAEENLHQMDQLTSGKAPASSGDEGHVRGHEGRAEASGSAGGSVRTEAAL